MTRTTHSTNPATPSRRRFIAITAASAGVAVLPRAARASVGVATWRGIALGAGASITLAGIKPRAARVIFRRIEAGLSRLEDIFSLYRPASALTRLNREGELVNPPAELLEVLSLSNAVNAATAGAFDPTVQPLWTLYARSARHNTRPTTAMIRSARARVGWGGVRFGTGRITFAHPGMALTLNGIAQGYITDRIAELLRTEGLRGVLVDMGEIRGLGQRPDGGPWRAGLRDPAGGVFPGYVPLADRALATSAPGATVLDSVGKVGHIFDPRTGRPGGLWRQVSVSASSAALADALATGLCLCNRAAIAQAVAAFPGAAIEKLIT